MMNLLIDCPFCGTTHEVGVDYEDFIRYQDGAPAQVAFPYLNATEREVIISGMCPDCQKKVFGEDE